MSDLSNFLDMNIYSDRYAKADNNLLKILENYLKKQGSQNNIVNKVKDIDLVRLGKVKDVLSSLNEQYEINGIFCISDCSEKEDNLGYFLSHLMAEMIVMAVEKKIKPFEQPAIDALKRKTLKI
jgi:hypothetical protein